MWTRMTPIARLSRWGRPHALGLLAAAWAGLAGPVGAQDPPAAGARLDSALVTLVGFVRDSLTAAPLPGAIVRLLGENLGVLTDSTGRFVLDEVPAGRRLLSVNQYGYEERLLAIRVRPEGMGAFALSLHPSPAVIEGLSVVTENLATIERRLSRRRNSAPFAVRTFEQERLLRSAARDAFEFVTNEGFVRPNACPPGAIDQWCIVRRGRLIAPTVFIDEVRAFGGLDDLVGYPAHEFYLIEVYSGGLQIRAYTHRFMDRMALHPMILLPLGVFVR